MQWGDEQSTKLFKLIHEDTGKHHPAYLNKPALRDDCIKYLDAFSLLSASRLWSEVGPQAIQLSEIESYFTLVGIREHGTKMKYVRLIRSLDSIHLKHINAERAKAQK